MSQHTVLSVVVMKTVHNRILSDMASYTWHVYGPKLVLHMKDGLSTCETGNGLVLKSANTPYTGSG